MNRVDKPERNLGRCARDLRKFLVRQAPSLVVACQALLIVGLPVCAAAATYPVNPQGSYIYVNVVGDPSTGKFKDVVVAPTVISLSSLGIKEGDSINVSTLGDMSFTCHPGVAGSCVISSVILCGVFSSSNSILSPGTASAPQINRVPGVVAPTFNPLRPCLTSPSFIGGIATDIPQDFMLDGTAATVPKGAQYLIMAVSDSYYADNADPNGHLAVNVVESAQGAIPANMSAHLKVNDTLSVINQVFSAIRSDPQNSALNENQIAEKAWTAIVDARNGSFGANNEFAFLQNVDLTTISNADHFAQAYYVSTGNTVVNNPISGVILGAIIDPVYNLGKAITQSTGYDFFATGSGPQSPANFDFWALAGADAALDESAPGNTPTDIAPILESDGTSVYVTDPAESVQVPLDPLLAYGFSYEVLGGGNVTSFEIPSSAVPGVTSYSLVYGTTATTVPVDSVYTFSPPVTRFTVEGLTPSGQAQIARRRDLRTHGAATANEFKSVLTFSPSGIASISQTACNQPTVALAAGSGCDGTYCGNYNGDIVVSQGQQCKFTSGQIHGNVVNEGGVLSLDATQVFGNVQAVSGISEIGPSTQINGRFYSDSRPQATNSDPRQMWMPILTKLLTPTGNPGEYGLFGRADIRISAPIVAGRKTGWADNDMDRLKIYEQATLSMPPPSTVTCPTGTNVRTDNPYFLILETQNPGRCELGTFTMTVAWRDIVSIETLK
jgi:hypothetical protein